ncbi:MAG: Gfo/Idh/MocA family oxidoreductase [Verrucomicrobia bacterium]|nr:Gfo/Idh/MocA family oxidoreductase [Verrucomicrobiota bacterium]
MRASHSPCKLAIDYAVEGHPGIPKCFQDIRAALEDKEWDVISIAAPSHWHSLLTIWACQAGKDVYVEKPLSHNIREGRRCIEAAKKYGRMVQHGTQQRSSGSRANEIAAVQSGKYGRLRVSKGYCCKPRWSIDRKPVEPPPNNLAFDLWLGPAPPQPYHGNLVHYNWHWSRDRIARRTSFRRKCRFVFNANLVLAGAPERRSISQKEAKRPRSLLAPFPPVIRIWLSPPRGLSITHKMRLIPCSALRSFGLLVMAALASRVYAAPLLDDRAITIHSAREVAQKRRALIQYLWGEEGFPKRRLPSVVLTNVASPVKQLSALARVDEFRIDMAPSLQGLAYHFIPQQPNRELVVVHHGHACTLDDDPSPAEAGYGMQRTIHALLREGYGVLGVFMPHMRPGDCTGRHDAMFLTNTVGSPIKYFLEPTAISLNYLKSRSRSDRFPNYRAFHMTGLSGGGWTTTVYAAIDPTIRCSFPVAGTIPLYLRYGGSVGDREQFEPTFYRLAGYPDLYILGAHGRGRKQVQILVRRDDCCFGEKQHDAKSSGLPYAEAMRDYERHARAALEKIGRSSFRLEIDEVAPSHMISHHAIDTVILPELRNARH